MNRKFALGLLILALAIAAPFLVYPVFLMKGLCFALFAVSFNLLLGYTGLLSFGHAAFFGMAAYVLGHAMTAWRVTPDLGLLAGTLAAGVMGLAFGFVAIRRQGIYFAMVTLALAQMVYFVCLQVPFTHGEDGIQSIPRGKLFGLLSLDDPIRLYVLVLVIVGAGCWLVWRTIHSPFGQVLRAIRENEPRAISLGYRTQHFKLAAFVLSAGLAGLAGATKALVFQLASLTDVHWHSSGEVVLMTLLGGMGTVLGPIAGAFVVVAIENSLAELGAWVTIIQGAIFIVVVLLFRRGLVGEALALVERLTDKRADAGETG
jgi:branched-chain amino acid transport system permease protein